MQTFLPYPDYEASARVLDRQRLGKQRVENLQIMGALILGTGWVNHPAVKMWDGYEKSFMLYQKAICDEWKLNRGYSDSCYEKTLDIFMLTDRASSPIIHPFWLGAPQIHKGHQSNLIRKDPEFYRPIFGDELPDDLPYYWPVS